MKMPKNEMLNDQLIEILKKDLAQSQEEHLLECSKVIGEKTVVEEELHREMEVSRQLALECLYLRRQVQKYKEMAGETWRNT